MHVEVNLIETKKDNFMLVFKKPNKIITKRHSKHKKNINQIDGLLSILNNFSPFCEKISFNSQVELTEQQYSMVSKNDKIILVEENSIELENYVKEIKQEILNPTHDHMKIGFVIHEEMVFMQAIIKSGEKRYEVIRNKRTEETHKEFIKRTLKSITANSGLSKDLHLHNANNNELARMVEKRLKRLGFSPINKEDHKINEQNFLERNSGLLKNKIKSEYKNNELKNKYMFNDEEQKNYKKPLIIYSDGSVFDDQKCGIGAVFTHNRNELSNFSLKEERNLDSNKCEARCILKALQMVHSDSYYNKFDYIEVRTDSLCCAERINEKMQVEETIEEIIVLIEKINAKVSIRWNKGHDGIFFNEKANELAREGALK